MTRDSNEIKREVDVGSSRGEILIKRVVAFIGCRFSKCHFGIKLMKLKYNFMKNN